MRAPVPTLAREAVAWAEGRLLVGVDEAGRGPLAGPVVAAAVVFPAGCSRGTLRGLRDSKLLPPLRRARLAEKIRARAIAIGIGAASVGEIDRFNIRKATALAMRRARAYVSRQFCRTGPCTMARRSPYTSAARTRKSMGVSGTKLAALRARPLSKSVGIAVSPRVALFLGQGYHRRCPAHCRPDDKLPANARQPRLTRILQSAAQPLAPMS